MNANTVETTGAVPTSVSRVRVRYAETDQMGVVYHANYLVWCDIGRTDLIRNLGTSYADLEKDGLLLAVADASVRYHASAKYDDVVEIVTTLERVQSRMLLFHYEIRRVEPAPVTRLATASTRLVALGRDGAPRTLPPDVLALFRGA